MIKTFQIQFGKLEYSGTYNGFLAEKITDVEVVNVATNQPYNGDWQITLTGIVNITKKELKVDDNH